MNALFKIIACILIFATSCQSYAIESVEGKADADEFYVPYSSVFDKNDGDYKFQILKKLDEKDINIPLCSESPLNFTICEPSVCKLNTIYGSIYFKISGLENNACKYIERSKQLDGMDCIFHKDELTTIDPIFNKRIKRISGVDVNITQNDIESAQKLYATNCSLIPNASISKIVTLDDEKEKESALPIDISDLENIKNILKFDPLSPFVKASTTTGAVVTSVDNYESIMFTKPEIDLIFLVQEVLRSNNSSSKASDTASLFNQNNLGQFYLSSLIYRTEKEWVLWVNTIKITNQIQPKALKVENVTSEKARFKWSTTNLDKLSPNWKNKMFAIDPNKYISRDYDIAVSLFPERAEITFGIKPNQTFDATLMKIYEGKSK